MTNRNATSNKQKEKLLAFSLQQNILAVITCVCYIIISSVDDKKYITADSKSICVVLTFYINKTEMLEAKSAFFFLFQLHFFQSLVQYC